MGPGSQQPATSPYPEPYQSSPWAKIKYSSPVHLEAYFVTQIQGFKDMCSKTELQRNTLHILFQI